MIMGLIFGLHDVRKLDGIFCQSVFPKLNLRKKIKTIFTKGKVQEYHIITISYTYLSLTNLVATLLHL